MRIISGSNYSSSSAPLYKDMNILPLWDLYKLHLGKLMYLDRNEQLPKYYKLNLLQIETCIHITHALEAILRL